MHAFFIMYRIYIYSPSSFLIPSYTLVVIRRIRIPLIRLHIQTSIRLLPLLFFFFSFLRSLLHRYVMTRENESSMTSTNINSRKNLNSLQTQNSQSSPQISSSTAPVQSTHRKDSDKDHLKCSHHHQLIKK